MLVSVIIPVYNVEKYLRRCIDSVLSQTFKDFELILVDDGSKDDCPRICDEYAQKDARIRAIHQENQGVSAARNAGLDAIRGDYVAFIDADDYVSGTFLNSLVSEAEVCPEAGVIISGHTDLFLDRTLRQCIERNRTCSLDKLKKDFASIDDEIGLGYPFGKLYKSALVRKTRFDSRIYLFEDMIFNLSVFSLCKLVRLIKGADYFYDHGNEQSATRKINAATVDCAKRRYVAGKLFLLGKVRYSGDYFDQTLCGFAVYFTHMACRLKMPWKKRKALIKLMLQDDLYKMVSGYSNVSSKGERLIFLFCRKRLYPLIRFYWWLRLIFRGS
jgi:glycosyltransferase involved in cell wall biosynthesis